MQAGDTDFVDFSRKGVYRKHMEWLAEPEKSTKNPISDRTKTRALGSCWEDLWAGRTKVNLRPLFLWAPDGHT